MHFGVESAQLYNKKILSKGLASFGLQKKQLLKILLRMRLMFKMQSQVSSIARYLEIPKKIYRKTLQLLPVMFLLLIAGNAFAAESMLREDSPNTHTVMQGDSLWKISGIFLNNPSRWPDIWQGNPSIEDPNLIYPGDVIVLRIVDGVPVLSVERPTEVAETLSDQPEGAAIQLPSLRVTEPTPGERLYFNSDRSFRAELQNHDSNALSFEIIVDGQRILGPLVVDVSLSGALRLATANVRIPQLSGQHEGILRVSTTDVEPPLQREIAVLIERDGIFMEILGGLDVSIGKPEELLISGSGGLRQIEWDFGDGWQQGGTSAQYTWNSYGQYTVNARAVGPDGLSIEANPLSIEVPVRPVGVRARLLVNNQELGSAISSAKLNSTVELVAETLGDVQRLEWYVDGVELPQDQTTITIDRMGRYSVEVVAIGTQEAGNARSQVDFGVSDRVVFWALLFFVCAVMAILAKLLLGNAGRLSSFELVEPTRYGLDFSKKYCSGRLGLSTSIQFDKERKTCGSWDYWRKTASCDVLKLVTGELMSADGTHGHIAIIKPDLNEPEIINRLSQIQTAAGENFDQNKYVGLWLYDPFSGAKKDAPKLFLALLRPKGKFLSRHWMDIFYFASLLPALYVIRQTFNTFY
jgi:PKD repeat protein/LysM repeat protein